MFVKECQMAPKLLATCPMQSGVYSFLRVSVAVCKTFHATGLATYGHFSRFWVFNESAKSRFSWYKLRRIDYIRE